MKRTQLIFAATRATQARNMTSFGLTSITLPIKDYDEALKFYCEKIGFTKKQDVVAGENNYAGLPLPHQTLKM